MLGKNEQGYLKHNGDVLRLEQLRQHFSDILSGMYSLGGRPEFLHALAGNTVLRRMIPVRGSSHQARIWRPESLVRLTVKGRPEDE